MSSLYVNFHLFLLFIVDLEDQTDPNIDEEMMKAYEDFLQDFEEHLLLQEFGEHPTNEGGMAP